MTLVVDQSISSMPEITFGSVCSGIEAASVAWEQFHMRAVWLAEIERAPSLILQHRYPNTPNLGDMTKIAAMVRNGEVPAPDILVGGTPCQAFSIAGLRKSLDDVRGQLTLSYVDLANAIDTTRAFRHQPPCVIVWENVPGVLSTKDNAFGNFLGALAGEAIALEPPGGRWPNAGCVFGPQRTVAWRIMDAQYFGVAQRRRRVFVIASARADIDPSEILFEFDSMRRDTAPSREARESLTHDVAPCLTSSGRGIERCGESRGQDPIVASFVAERNDEGGHLYQTFDRQSSGEYGTAPVASTMSARDFKSPSDLVLMPAAGHGLQDHTVAYAIQAGALRINPDSGPDGIGVQTEHAYTLEARSEVQAVCVTGDITHTLKAEGFDGSEDGSGRGQPIVAIGCDGTVDGPVPPLMARSSRGGAQTLSPGHQTDGHVIGVGMAVRRLTPRECERLQGFRDDYTLVPVKKVNKRCSRHAYSVIDGALWQMLSDGPRYKALGNSMAVPCMAWIGARIAASLRAGGVQ